MMVHRSHISSKRAKSRGWHGAEKKLHKVAKEIKNKQRR